MVRKNKFFIFDIFVLFYDYNVIMYFEWYDVVIFIMVLEEFDKFKIGNDMKNFLVREVICFIDKIFFKGGL